MTEKVLYVAILWHYHQPIYKDSLENIYYLPWVRLHAIKDYYDMVALLDEFTKIKINFNFVPSLLVQLSDYGNKTAKDKYLDMTLKNSAELTDEDKIWLLQNFFMANWETMVYPYRRYAQLLNMRGKFTPTEELIRRQQYFTEQDFRDLQVWFNLAWFDPYWRKIDPIIAELFNKQQNFTEEDKHTVINKQLEICSKVVNKYCELQQREQIEISISPFYHPILPLLCDTSIATISAPGIILPKNNFRHIEDARIQIARAIKYYENIFNRRPNGLWPPEGAISDDVLRLLSEEGILWTATDEDILFATLRKRPEEQLPREIVYQPYTVLLGTHRINIFFRDRILSNLIGFVYQHWDPTAAVNDFIKRLEQIYIRIKNLPGEHLVSIILDGENCWEFYHNDGYDFLRLLYSRLSEEYFIKTTTFTNFLKNNTPQVTFRHIYPGSWINANYSVWIGHPEDNLAWEYLTEVRSFVENYQKRYPEKGELISRAMEEIYISEGSDWCWWYGDEHSSSHDEIFDLLFRKHLMNVYTILGEDIPDFLHVAIKGRVRKNPTLLPVDFITPKLDGRVTNYFEWRAAGYYKTGHKGGTMHQTESIISSFHYGFDLDNLYLRLDLQSGEFDENPINEFEFEIIFLKPNKKHFYFRFDSEAKLKYFYLEEGTIKKDLKTIALDKIIELAIPFELLGIAVNEKAEFILKVSKITPTNERYEIERWPYQSSVIFVRPTEEFIYEDWSA